MPGASTRLKSLASKYWPVCLVFFLVAVVFGVLLHLHPDFRHRLWNKNADIAANAVSGLCLAVVALGSWFLQQEVSLWYKRRELLQKVSLEESLSEAQQKRIDSEAKEEAKRKVVKLEEQREALATMVENAKSASQAHEALSAYFQWLTDNDLGWPHNVRIIENWSGAYKLYFLQSGRHEWPGAKEELVGDIRSTQVVAKE